MTIDPKVLTHQLYNRGYGRATKAQREAAAAANVVGVVAPTMMRRMHMQDHFPPAAGIWFEDQEYRLWHGHSRHQHPGRRKANKRTWAKLIRERRKEYMERKRAEKILGAPKRKSARGRKVVSGPAL